MTQDKQQSAKKNWQNHSTCHDDANENKTGHQIFWQKVHEVLLKELNQRMNEKHYCH